MRTLVFPLLLLLGVLRLFSSENPPLAAAEIRVLQGRYLELHTDLPPGEAVDELPRVFDLAVPFWCDRLGIDVKTLDDWKMTGCLIKDFALFKKAGLVKEVPQLRTGFQWNEKLWLLEQESDYYRRHLLLHEGVHGIMARAFHGLGPSWYREGLAELYATHTWEDGKLVIGEIPSDRDAVPMWGRIKLIRADVDADKGHSLLDVMNLRPKAYDDPDAYAWSWALCRFLEARPETEFRLRRMTAHIPRGIATPETEKRFNDKFLEILGDDTVRDLSVAWVDFVGHLDYGYDLRRAPVDSVKPGRELEAGKTPTLTVRSDRGWQNSGIWLHEDQLLQLTATGRFQLDDTPGSWWSEPNGITIRYHGCRPLGELQLALLPTHRSDLPPPFETPKQATARGAAFLEPWDVGYGREFVAPDNGTLFFRINDSPADLANNKGTVRVTIECPAVTESETNDAAQPVKIGVPFQ